MKLAKAEKISVVKRRRSGGKLLAHHRLAGVALAINVKESNENMAAKAAGGGGGEAEENIENRKHRRKTAWRVSNDGINNQAILASKCSYSKLESHGNEATCGERENSAKRNL
jgi:hypothetical protein